MKIIQHNMHSVTTRYQYTPTYIIDHKSLVKFSLPRLMCSQEPLLSVGGPLCQPEAYKYKWSSASRFLFSRFQCGPYADLFLVFLPLLISMRLMKHVN